MIPDNYQREIVYDSYKIIQAEEQVFIVVLITHKEGHITGVPFTEQTELYSGCLTECEAFIRLAEDNRFI